jgi:hypothetical protein
MIQIVSPMESKMEELWRSAELATRNEEPLGQTNRMVCPMESGMVELGAIDGEELEPSPRQLGMGEPWLLEIATVELVMRALLAMEFEMVAI